MTFGATLYDAVSCHVRA